ncbi:RNA methyltransferase [Sphingobacterium sp. lm-10]|uniref:methyltransferase RsmF C-terminal domain-like protein n=1 Tax=Sphingobacterium sp. lm-10 TaxID=2944904 RepID=UPI0020224D65|nr:RNA methyltransferase [Sphingobacterium sp. lm-10]MCL7988383.1 RNA methyltransferase [Sphingobacterium sp. lm-10]
MSNFLPNELIKRLNEEPEFNMQAFLQVHENEQKISSIRINPAKLPDPESVLAISERVPWCDRGYFLEKRPVYTLDPLYHAGAYYSQEASSMFLAFATQSLQLDTKPLVALDLCAAPGGKSTLLQSYLSEDSLLVSNEIIKSRANILEENSVKWGGVNVVVTNNDPVSFGRLPGFFDLLVVDAPCSGSGMFRKDHDAIDEWSEANVKLCADRQRRILADTMTSLKTGGYLFYSTCSYSREENEEVVNWLIEEFELAPIPLEVPEEWGIIESRTDGAPGYRFYPHEVKGEGFFFAVLQKKGEQSTFSKKKIKTEKNHAPKDELSKWINDEGLYGFLHHDQLHAFPKKFEIELEAMQKVLYLKNAGTRLGKWTGRELIPAHDLALSLRVRKDIAGITLDLDLALQFLRKENLDASINTSGKTGWLLVRYQGINLGWIKALPNRINNYYPKELRISNL